MKQTKARKENRLSVKWGIIEVVTSIIDNNGPDSTICLV